MYINYPREWANVDVIDFLVLSNFVLKISRISVTVEKHRLMLTTSFCSHGWALPSILSARLMDSAEVHVAFKSHQSPSIDNDSRNDLFSFCVVMTKDDRTQFVRASESNSFDVSGNQNMFQQFSQKKKWINNKMKWENFRRSTEKFTREILVFYESFFF